MQMVAMGCLSESLCITVTNTIVIQRGNVDSHTVLLQYFMRNSN